MVALEAGLRYRLRRAIRQIASQHAHLREALSGLGAAIGAGERDAGLARYDVLHDAIEAHFALEDGVIFPALAELRPECGAELEALVADHRRFLDELWRIRDRIESAQFDPCAKAFQMLEAALRDHELREEKLVAGLVERD